MQTIASLNNIAIIKELYNGLGIYHFALIAAQTIWQPPSGVKLGSPWPRVRLVGLASADQGCGNLTLTPERQVAFVHERPSFRSHRRWVTPRRTKAQRRVRLVPI
jgi:hypothetical protein